MLSIQALSLDGVMLDEAKAYLRLETDEDDAPLGALLLAAISHAEGYTRQVLIRRSVNETITATTDWGRLSAMPVSAINSVTGIPAEGAAFLLPASDYKTEIEPSGEGFIRVMQPGGAGRVEVAYLAGLSVEWASLPENIRLGILRLAGHFYTHRDAGDDAGPPTAVAALLRPWRRMRLS